jgi:hypothetical protein
MKKRVILLAVAALVVGSLALQSPVDAGGVCEDCHLIDIPDPEGNGTFERALCWIAGRRADGYLVCWEVHIFGVSYCHLDYYCGSFWVP